MKRSQAQISYNMSRIRNKGSVIEKEMSSALSRLKIRGYRKNLTTIEGKPDFSWKKYKIAVFCDSSFWHGYKNMKTKLHDFKRRKRFWIDKISRNITRDKTVNKNLRKEGWEVIRFWDFMILRSPDKCAEKVRSKLIKQGWMHEV